MPDRKHVHRARRNRFREALVMLAEGGAFLVIAGVIVILASLR